MHVRALRYIINDDISGNDIHFDSMTRFPTIFLYTSVIPRVRASHNYISLNYVLLCVNYNKKPLSVNWSS